MAKILIISEDLWYPPIYGDGIRQFHLLRHLSKKHEYTWCCRYRNERKPEDEGTDFARSESFLIPSPKLLVKLIKVFPYFLSNRPLKLAAYRFKILYNRIKQLTASEPFDIIQIEHTKMAEYVNAISPSSKAIKILTIQNLQHVFLERLIKYEKNLFWKIIYRSERNKYLRWEKRIIKNFDAFITVNNENINWLKQNDCNKMIHFSRNGVDVDRMPFLSQSVEPILIMPGSMDYPPNIDAAVFFTKEVLPLIWDKNPDVKFLIVGQNPVEEVKVLGFEHRVQVTGKVPDMVPFYKSACLTVVPLRVGSGTRLKIVESMALGRVVLSTTIGAEGLDYKRNENIFIEDDPKKMAKKIILLLSNRALREQVSFCARNHIEKRYNAVRIAEDLDGFYHTLLNKSYN